MRGMGRTWVPGIIWIFRCLREVRETCWEKGTFWGGGNEKYMEDFEGYVGGEWVHWDREAEVVRRTEWKGLLGRFGAML